MVPRLFTEPYRLVLDTNVLVRGFAYPDSASARLLRLCESRKLLMLLSRPILLEYLDVLGRIELTGSRPAIAEGAVRLMIERLRYLAEFIDPVRARFRFDRDPEDACFLELAIAGRATHLVSHDKDLLTLPNAHTDAGKRFRQRLRNLKIMEAAAFLSEFESLKPEQ